MTISNESQVQFSYTLPDGSTETETRTSNIVKTEVISYSFIKVKSSNKTFLQEGEKATQTVQLTNNSLFNISNLFFTDTMSTGATHVSGSVTVNGVSQPSYDVSTGFALADLAPNGVATVTYDVIADNPLTVTPVQNFGTVNYSVGSQNFNENTNTISLIVVSNRLTIIKTVDKEFAVIGDKLHYVSTITNTGTLVKTNLTFTDPIPTGTSFVSGSVKIDGVSQPSYDPAVGFPFANLAVGASTVVEFDVTVL